MSELKPCPFCGETPKVVPLGPRYCIECVTESCQVVAYTIGTKSKEGAILAWNTRAESAQEVELRRLRIENESILHDVLDNYGRTNPNLRMAADNAMKDLNYWCMEASRLGQEFRRLREAMKQIEDHHNFTEEWREIAVEALKSSLGKEGA